MAEINDLLVAPFFRTTVTITAAKSQAFITVADSSGFPVPTGAKYFYLTTVVGDAAKVYTVVGNDMGSNTLEVSEVLQETILVGARAEHWFTAEAFEDIQSAIDGLGGSVVIPPDGITILGGASLKVGLIDGTYLELNNTIQAEHLADGSVREAALGPLAVTNNKVATGINANKIASLSNSKLPVDTIPEITFAQIDYTVGGDPSGGAPGDIFIEWEDYVA